MQIAHVDMGSGAVGVVGADEMQGSLEVYPCRLRGGTLFNPFN